MAPRDYQSGYGRTAANNTGANYHSLAYTTTHDHNNTYVTSSDSAEPQPIIDEYFSPISQSVLEAESRAESRAQQFLNDVDIPPAERSIDQHVTFSGQSVSGLVGQVQQNVPNPVYLMNGFPWSSFSDPLLQPEFYQSGPAQFNPTVLQERPVLSLECGPVGNADAQPRQTESASSNSWVPVPSDHSASQRTSGEWERLYATEGYPSIELTGAGPVESPQVCGPISVAQTSHTGAHNSRLSTPNDCFTEDGVSLSDHSNPRKRRGELSPEGREKAKIMRVVGNCLRCKMMKLSCDEGNPCGSCLAVLGKARTYRELCNRENLDTVAMARQGNSEFEQEMMTFREYHWKYHTQTKALQLRWTLPNGYRSKLPDLFIECQEYVPRQGDVTVAKWQDMEDNGRVTEVLLPAFACRDTNGLLQSVRDFLNAGREAVEIDMMDQITDKLERLTMEEAYRQRHQSSIVMLALRIRANTILSAGWGTPVGDETLGIPRIVNASAGQVGDRPLPPAIDHQIDVAIWERIKEDQKSLLKELKKKLFGQAGPKPWLEIFLTFYVSLANIQYVHGQATAWMKCQQQTDAAPKVTYRVKEMIARWNASAKNIIYHFRAIFRGDLPLIAAEKDLDRFRKQERLDDRSTTYVRNVLRALKEPGETFLKQTMGSTFPDVTESGDHWTRQLFIHQYQALK